MSKFILTLILFFSFYTSALAHSWYDKECCSDQDCAPVDKTVYNEDGSLTVTSKYGTVTIPEGFPRKASKDEKDHVCILGNPGYQTLICYYVTGGY